MEDKLPAGQLVELVVTDLNYTEDGFATGVLVRGQGLMLYEKIDLNSYPSVNDFTGESSVVNDGDRATIVRFVGRPVQVQKDPRWFKYDVYEIYVAGSIRQIFRQNIKPIFES